MLSSAMPSLRSRLKRNAPAAVGCLVVHNKLKPKKGSLPPGVTYIAGDDVPNAWNCYPWDAQAYGRDIYAHEELARACHGESSDHRRLALAAVAGAVVAGCAVAFAKRV